MDYSIPKGVFDILPFEPNPENCWRSSDRWQWIEKVIRHTCHLYGYREIRTPIFERTELFIRGVGEASDIVSKEMYTFKDKGDRSMTLRPEGTASVMRAFVENKLYTKSGAHKFFYIGPMFRYERPQAGRYRQHHQFGAEVIGANQPEQDVELIDLVHTIYQKLGLRNLKILINSVGSIQSRKEFCLALRNYLSPHLSSLSADSQIRYEKNTLRILDSKDPKDQEILANAPSILEFLSPEDKTHFQTVTSLLSTLGISYEITPKLVRGLDYYNKTVFEITSGELGSQNSIGGGGRYDGLTETIGGPNLPSVGFATGLERVLQVMDRQKAPFPEPPHPTVVLIPLGDPARHYCFTTCISLRHQGISAEIDLSGKKLQHGLQLANSLKADYCIVIGDQEITDMKAQLKHLSSRQSVEISLTDLANALKGHYKNIDLLPE